MVVGSFQFLCHVLFPIWNPDLPVGNEKAD